MKTLKRPPNATEARALREAEQAANRLHDQMLESAHCTASMRVPEEVEAEARIAYRLAGGRRELAVGGRGNSTHPVCSIRCRILALA